MKNTFLLDTKSFYIHWPFCPYRCNFCSFVAMAGHENFMEQYHMALCKELEMFSDSYAADKNLETIYIGGGTPSLYPNILVLDMFGKIRSSFNFEKSSEVTIEVNPGTVQKEQLSLWKELGVNRLSIGVQSLNDNVLKKLNRLQTAKDVFNLLQDAPKFYNNISIDLILGLPGVSKKEWENLLKEVITWPIKHISVYFLTVHEDTPLFFKIKTKQLSELEEDLIVEQYKNTVDFLDKNGFEQYELSNFAKKGFESKHNQVYWDRKPYKGFGLGASSFNGQSRFVNEKNLISYLKKIEQGVDLTSFSEKLTKKQVFLEKLMLGLRQRKGLSIIDLENELINKKTFFEKIRLLEEKGLIKKRNDKLYLTLDGLSVENEIILQLCN